MNDDERAWLQAMLEPMAQGIKRVEDRTEQIDTTLRQKQIDDAQERGKITAEMDSVRIGLNGIGKKVSDHIASHWQFILTSAGTVGIILAAAAYMAKHQ